MQKPQRSWELIFFTWIITFTVLIGCSYVIAINYQLPIPWFALLVIAILITIAAQIARERRAQQDS
jgi:ABC-type iron transport system FetAB permease component